MYLGPYGSTGQREERKDQVKRQTHNQFIVSGCTNTGEGGLSAAKLHSLYIKHFFLIEAYLYFIYIKS